MKIFLIILPLIVFSSCNGQSKTKPTNSLPTTITKKPAVATISGMKVGDFSFPVIKLSDKVKTERINNYIVNAALGEDFTVTNLKSELDKQRKKLETSYSGLTGLSYKVVFNNPTILSISINSCWTGNRETCDDAQFNFDLTTGYNFGLDQILKPSSWYEIKKLICNDAKKRLIDGKNKAKKEIDNWYEKDMLDLTYEGQWQDELKKLEYCGVEIGKNFKLSKDGMSFYFDQMTFLAMSIRELKPDPEYFYSWSLLKPYLMPSSPISSLIK